MSSKKRRDRVIFTLRQKHENCKQDCCFKNCSFTEYDLKQVLQLWKLEK